MPQAPSATPVRAGDPGWTAHVLDFWFGELAPADWFGKDDGVDARIRARFEGLHTDLSGMDGAGPLRVAAATAKGALAAVIVLDQFPRNLYRGEARAFASDALALDLAERAVALGFDRLLRRQERLFLYLPFEHGENRDTQARSVELIGRLGDAEWTRYAIAHKAIIDRFGRFPHRNEALGRASTEDEIAFLKTPGSGF